MARGNSITVRIVGDERDLLRSYARSQAASSKFASHVEKSGRGALAASGAFSHLGRAVSFASTSFLGGAGLVYALKSSIGAASDLHEQVNKTDVVFGRSAGVVKSWSKTTARSIGIAQHEALGFASTFGNLLHPMGIARAEAAKMSVRLVKLAADMASFNNASPEETLRALQAGLVGQVRPLRQFGVFLSDARVKAEAFADGIAKADVNQRKVAESSRAVEIAQFKLNEARKKYGEHSVQAAQAELTLQRAQDKLTSTMKGSKVELTDQQKALARYRIILKDTADSQGDFRRTSGGLANQQRILKAEISDLEAEIGTALMPTVLKITRAVTTWLAKSENHEKIQRALNSALKIAKQVVEALWQVVVPLSKALQHVVDAMGGWNRAIKVFVAFALAAKLAKIAAELRAIGLALGLSKGAGIVGAASRARLGLAALASASVIGGLSGLLAILGRIAGAAGKIAGYGFGGVPDQPGVANRLPDKTPLLTPAKVGQVVTDRSGRKWRWTGSRWVSADATGPGAAANRPDNRGGARGPGADEPKMIQDARRFGPGSGIKYVWGGASPQTGFDCSGYVMYVYGRSGIKIPHNSVAQFNDPNAIHVPRGQIQAGDALYFRTSGPGAAPQHVGLAISGGANATFIEYFSAGKPAKYNTINAKGGFMGARRWMKIKTSTGGGNDKPKTGGGNDAGTITTGKTGGGAKPVLPASFSVGIENAKRTPGVADDLKALGRAHDFLVEKLSHAKTPAERLPIVKALNAIDAAIKKIKASEAKKKLDQIHAAFEKTWGKLTDAALKAFDRATDRGLDELQRKFDAKMKALDDGLQATLDAIEATRSELTPAEAEIAALEEARSQKDLEDRIAEARQAIDEAQQQEGESDEDFAKRKKQLQKDLDDALYDQKIRALQKQADAERKAKDEAAAKAAKAAQDANQAQKDALQTSYDDQVQAYRDERELLRDHLDEMLADLLKFYLARNELAKKAREDLIAFIKQHPELGISEADINYWTGGAGTTSGAGTGSGGGGGFLPPGSIPPEHGNPVTGGATGSGDRSLASSTTAGGGASRGPTGTGTAFVNSLAQIGDTSNLPKGTGTIIFSSDDPNLAGDLAAARKMGFKVGINVPSAGMDPVAYGNYAAAIAKKYNPDVLVPDIEGKEANDPAWNKTAAGVFRAAASGQNVGVTTEPNKPGSNFKNWNPSVIYPQAYFGPGPGRADMTPANIAGVIAAASSAGVPVVPVLGPTQSTSGPFAVWQPAPGASIPNFGTTPAPSIAPSSSSSGIAKVLGAATAIAIDPNALQKVSSSASRIGIRALASGGIVRSPTLAMIGEGGDEAVVPLGRGGALGEIVVPVTLELDGEVLYRKIVKKQAGRDVRRNGSTGF